MSAGGMQCRASSTGGVLLYVVGPEVRQGAQMCSCLQSFRPSPEPTLALLFRLSLGWPLGDFVD